jgi:hypothetical protein
MAENNIDWSIPPTTQRPPQWEQYPAAEPGKAPQTTPTFERPAPLKPGSVKSMTGEGTKFNGGQGVPDKSLHGSASPTENRPDALRLLMEGGSKMAPSGPEPQLQHDGSKAVDQAGQTASEMGAKLFKSKPAANAGGGFDELADENVGGGTDGRWGAAPGDGVTSRPGSPPKSKGLDPGKDGKGRTTHASGAGVIKNVPLPGFGGARWGGK